jgi:hypothetical protein
MKTVKLTAIAAVAGLALLFAACAETESIDESLAAAEKSAEMLAEQGDSCTYDGVLTQEEIDGLLFMREEEKLAHDVYSYFDGMYDIAIFGNIAKSEDTHTNAVLSLLEGYGIEDPALDGVGEFSIDVFNELYSSLTLQGSDSLTAALIVGATIEDLDIFDLTELLKVTVNEDLVQVYTNLLKGSENHMGAFVSALENLGATYTPQYISDEEYEAILAASNEKGNGNKGQTNENGQGNSNGNKGNGASGNASGDKTQSGSANGTQSGDCDETQTGSATANQNGNSGSNGKG